MKNIKSVNVLKLIFSIINLIETGIATLLMLFANALVEDGSVMSGFVIVLLLGLSMYFVVNSSMEIKVEIDKKSLSRSIINVVLSSILWIFYMIRSFKLGIPMFGIILSLPILAILVFDIIQLVCRNN